MECVQLVTIEGHNGEKAASAKVGEPNGKTKFPSPTPFTNLRTLLLSRRRTADPGAHLTT